MPKRKDLDASSGDESGSDNEIVNIDFDFFDPREIDYLALKRLLNQLFQGDAESFSAGDLADLIISQPQVGSTVKTDDINSDPFGFLTVLNLNVHKDHTSIKALISYMLSKSMGSPEVHQHLQQVIGPEGLSSSSHVGLVLGERLVNMPVQIIPPMFRMLQEEMGWAVDEKEPFQFTEYIVLSRLYRLAPSDVDQMIEEDAAQTTTPKKKKKKRAEKSVEEIIPTAGVYSFHMEDEVIEKLATFKVDYDFSNSQDREGSENLGLDVAARMMVLPASRFSELVTLLSTEYPVPGA